MNKLELRKTIQDLVKQIDHQVNSSSIHWYVGYNEPWYTIIDRLVSERLSLLNKEEYLAELLTRAYDLGVKHIDFDHIRKYSLNNSYFKSEIESLIKKVEGKAGLTK